MAEIFLSCRRQDSQSATGRLADRLEQHFGAERVFRDHESIVAGEDFAEAIRRAIEASTVVLVAARAITAAPSPALGAIAAGNRSSRDCSTASSRPRANAAVPGSPARSAR